MALAGSNFGFVEDAGGLPVEHVKVHVRHHLATWPWDPWPCGVMHVGPGDGEVLWVYARTAVVVTVPPAGRPVQGETDLRVVTVRVDVRPGPRGGESWHWYCPGCGRRCTVLFVGGGPVRLSCRVCAKLKFKSQYRAWPRRRR